MGYPDTALVEPATVAAHGAKVLNLHQGVDGMLNPYINYPFDPKVATLAEPMPGQWPVNGVFFGGRRLVGPWLVALCHSAAPASKQHLGASGCRH